MKAYGGLKKSLHAYTILALDRGESLLHTPGTLPLRKNPHANWIGRLVVLSGQRRHSMKTQIFSPLGMKDQWLSERYLIVRVPLQFCCVQLWICWC